MQPALGTASPSALGWSALPADLLVVIFARVQLRPRLRVVSLVCRRWRAAVLRSVTAIDHDAPASLYALPSLTAIDDEDHFVSSRLRHVPSPSLKSLSYSTASFKCECHLLRGLTSLQRLHLRLASAKICCSSLAAFIARSTSSLTDLKIKFDATTKRLSFAPIFLDAVAGLTSLRSLSVSASDPSLAHQFVQPHASRLTHLGVATVAVFADAPGVPRLCLPACRSLTVRHSAGKVTPLANLAAIAPALTSLSLTCLDTCHDFPIDSFPYSALTSLDVLSLPNMKMPWLAHCTALRSLTAHLWTSDIAYLPPLPSLQKLKLGPAVVVAKVGCRELTTLRISAEQFLQVCGKEWPLPLLRRLDVTFRQTQLIGEFRGVLRTVLDATRLEHVTVQLRVVPSIKPVGDLIGDLRASGVETVTIVAQNRTLAALLTAESRVLIKDFNCDPWTTVRICVLSRMVSKRPAMPFDE